MKISICRDLHNYISNFIFVREFKMLNMFDPIRSGFSGLGCLRPASQQMYSEQLLPTTVVSL